MAILTFQTENPIPQQLFEEFFSKELCQNEFYWFTDYDDDFFKDTENQSNEVVHIRFEKFAEHGFCYYYEIWSNLNDLDLDEETEILKRLAQFTQIQIMASDDQIAGFLWQIIDTDGNSFTGVIDDNIEESLILVACESTLIASFYTQTVLSNDDENCLKELFKAFYPAIILEYENDNLANQTDLVNFFDETALKDFAHHYYIYPVILKTWKSKKSKAEIAIGVLQQWQEYYPNKIFLFPADYEQIESVQGGCDSRKYCVVMSDGTLDKIEYKQPKDIN